MKLFLSYCHKDESHKDDFRKHISPLTRQGRITEWHDRKIMAGSKISEEIDPQMQSADVIVLFISSNFMNSDACQKEMERALELQQNGTRVVPVIVSPCCWRDSPLKDILACPRDGKPVDEWTNRGNAWVNVVEHMKHLLDNHTLLKKELKEEFCKFLEDPGDFLHSNRAEVLKLCDFYVPPILQYIPDMSDKNDIVSRRGAEFLTSVSDCAGKCFMILGDDWSGKTALCQMVCEKWNESSYIPVYIDGRNATNDNLAQLENLAFKRQYKNLHYERVSNDQKVIIFDNFAGEHINKRDAYSLLKKLRSGKYYAVVLVASEANPIFMTVRWEEFVVEHDIEVHRIAPVNYKARLKVIQRWMKATHKEDDISSSVTKAQMEDEYMEFINSMFGENKLPLYIPYIILMLEGKSGASALNPNARDSMSSYGHCYEAVITHRLLMTGIAPKDIGAYHMFLAEFAYYVYTKRQFALTRENMSEFFATYGEKYIGNPQQYTEKLVKCSFLARNLLGDISMPEHAFYYYVAKRLSLDFHSNAGREQAQKEIDAIFSGVHRKRNGHILLFLVHHMPKNEYLLMTLNKEIGSLFDDVSAAKLVAGETARLREFLNGMPVIDIDANVSKSQQEVAKLKKFEARDNSDKAVTQHAEDAEHADDESALSMINIGKTFRMMKIAGSLLKNERKTMEKKPLVALSISTRDVALRVISWAHNVIANHSELFKDYLEAVVFRGFPNWENLPLQKRKDILTSAVGHLAVNAAYNMIDRCARCIGSDELTSLMSQTNDGESYPSHQLVHLATKMWCAKKLDPEEIKILYNEWQGDNFMSAHLLQRIVATHLQMHEVKRDMRQKIAYYLGLNIKSQNLIEYRRRKE